MTADVNVTEKVAKRLFASPVSNQAARTAPEIMALCDEAAREALAALADPEVLAGIAGVVEEHAINGRRTWQWVYCACGWVAKEETTADGYREHREHVAAAVVEWLRGRAL